MAKKKFRLIDADRVLRRAGFKMPSQEVLVMQSETYQAEKDAKSSGAQFKIPALNSLEMKRRADQFRKNELRKII